MRQQPPVVLKLLPVVLLPRVLLLVVLLLLKLRVQVVLQFQNQLVVVQALLVAQVR